MPDLISHTPVGESLSIAIDDLMFVSDLKAQAGDYHINFDSTPDLDHDFFRRL